MKIRNIHPYGAVDVRIPTDPPTYLHLEAGEIFEATDAQAASLLEQPTNFEAVTEAATTSKEK